MDELDDIMGEFLVETYEGLDQMDRDLVALEQEPASSDVIGRIFRAVHTIKGSSGFLSLPKLGGIAHLGENLLSLLREGRCEATAEITSALLAMADAIRDILACVERERSEGDEDFSGLLSTLSELVEDPANNRSNIAQSSDGADSSAGANGESGSAVEAARASVAAQSLRVDVGLLDSLMNLVGELVLARNQILQVTGSTEDPELIGTCQRLNQVTTELQDGVMKTRMQAIGSMWTKFPRVVRDLTVSCGKQVRLEMEGQETELDKTIIESIKDPLTHAIRNAVDHGVEPSGERLNAGKPEQGCLRLRAFHEGGQVHIEICDDGRGINPVLVLEKAVSSGLVSAERAAHMSDREAIRLIMEPGFSTAQKVTSVSGRGVGMDVVKTNIESIGGTIDIHSVVGEGTTLCIKIPLTLAIIPALIVTSGGDRFAIPQVSLLGLVRLEHHEVHSGIEYIDGAPVYRLRGELLPLVHLDEQLDHGAAGSSENRDASLVVLQADGRQFGLVVEAILDTEEIVVKPLGKQLGAVQALAGAAIMGDGRVALILDVLGISKQANTGGKGRQPESADASVEASAGEECGSWLLVAVGQDRRVAIDLSTVARLEELAPTDIERTGGREVVQYRGEIMPLIRLAPIFGLSTQADGDQNLQVVVVKDGLGRSAGLVVSDIMDILDEQVEVMSHSVCRGVRGAATLQGRVTDLLDVKGLVAEELAAMGITSGTAAMETV